MQRKRRRGAPATFEQRLWREGRQFVAGVDEAGRGAWAGPVVAAAVIMPPRPRVVGVCDSKIVPAAERERLWEEIRQVALAWGVGVISSERIGEINILRATFEAMAQALASLEPGADFVLFDGRYVPEHPLPHLGVVGGDRRCYTIAAASIGAKVTRDALMREMGADFPEYGFERHKGYGTKEHRRALRDFGPCPHHRFTYAPVRAIAQGTLDLSDPAGAEED